MNPDPSFVKTHFRMDLDQDMDILYHVRVVEVVSDPTRNRSLRLGFRIREIKKIDPSFEKKK